MPMTNKALKAMIEKHGDKIFAFVLDNNRKLFFNVDGGSPENAVSPGMLIFETVEGVDMVGVPRHDSTWGTGRPVTVDYVHWLATEFIQSIATTNELGSVLPDLNKFF